mgnify:CR=1 FL=1|tara:strand:- start:6636 stop:6947 length:312 start_codon:yes stop_codon:yes gene_type:complete
MSMFRHQAIYNTHSNVVGVNEHRGAIDKDDNIVTLDEDKVAEEEAKLQAEYDSKQYQRDRKYPDLGEQFDLLFKDIDSGKVSKDGGFYKAIKAVKDKHPKPSE